MILLMEEEVNELPRKMLIVKDYLAKYGIAFEGDENDFSRLYGLYILGDGTERNPPMNEWLGDDEGLLTKIEYRKTHENTLEQFVNFVLMYE